MIVSLFPFQQKAVKDLRLKVATALRNYRYSLEMNNPDPQVVSLQAPTGAGKTIIMASFIESVLFGSDQYQDQPEAIFVWLSDSPSLNEQSKEKIDLKSDRIKLSQCVMIEDENFDMEMLEDGHIYFLNTQKLSATGKLGRLSDNRQYTIWETLENTAREKWDRLYFIIDEAHRGMLGDEGGRATSIMQRFIKGSKPFNLSPMPLVVWMSATPQRFNQLVGNATSTLQKVVIHPNEVKASGLLKDRIIITYPENSKKHSLMSVLKAATEEWIDKCRHWYQYCYEQHYGQVNPVFVVQVLAGKNNSLSDTDLDEVISCIEETTKVPFKEHEVVHTFGSTGTITINKLPVHHINPSDITDDNRIKVVLFKENLSTGWDCPRAEAMMSFRHAEDATYIAQLLGRMIRTPRQSRILVDESLNDVRLFLPLFNADTVGRIIDELQATEGGELPTIVDEESLDRREYVTWTARNPRAKVVQDNKSGYLDFYSDQSTKKDSAQKQNQPDASNPSQALKTEDSDENNQTSTAFVLKPSPVSKPNSEQEKEDLQLTLPFKFDREKVIKFINDQAYLSFSVRTAKISNYLKSLLQLSGLLTRTGLFKGANDEVMADIVEMIRNHSERLKREGRYGELSANVTNFKLSLKIYNAFGEQISNTTQTSLFMAAESDIDRQLRSADASLGACGISNAYGRKYFDDDHPNSYKVDCILFAIDEHCNELLNQYAKKKFNQFNDDYRRKIAQKNESVVKEYKEIVKNSDLVAKLNFTLPQTLAIKLDQDGIIYQNHLYADEKGESRIQLDSSWEVDVLNEEFKRADFVCWLRNFKRSPWALCIPYEQNNEIKAMYPDFLIVRQEEDSYVVDILEPHDPSRTDNLGKAKGLAEYAKQELKIGRVQLIRKTKGLSSKFVRLEMNDSNVREKVLRAMTNEELNHLFEVYGITF